MGDAMVATFVLTTYQDPTTCDRATLRSLITDLWQRGDGGWRLVLRQSGPVGGPGALGAQFAKEAPPPPRWSGRAEVSFVSTGGNTSTQSLGLGGALDYRPGPWLTTATVSLVRAETADAVTARSLTLDLRQARDVSPRLALFGHGAYLRDTFAGIEHRVGVDGGVGYKVLTTAPHALKVDVGVGYTSETRVAEADRSFAIATMTFRYVLALSGTTELTQDGSFTASLQETEDWRYANTVALSASLNSIISLKLSHALKHLNLPVTGFRKTDTIVAAALVARF